MNEQINEATSMVERMMPDIVDYGVKLVGVIVLFIVGRWLGKRVQKSLLKRLERRAFDLTLARFFL